ncbi:MAG: hypothetical protein N2323_01215 [candidate division WOR-3 bacterium]|nr:hypothetical protein [candidate division WOR-3 bacterium]MCX7836566.1 hypothetical protein [candidate division WOR-3 bacterium]MDW8113911.1 hypothetical protein [candidate division WOR-3 bacterium]
MKKFLFLYSPFSNLSYQENFPPKGADYFLKEKEEIIQMKNLLTFDYQDLRIRKLDLKDYEYIFLYCDFLTDFPTINFLTEEILINKKRLFLFGPLITHYFYYQPTLLENLKEKELSLIIGFLPNIISEILEDINIQRIKKIYQASSTPNYFPSNSQISLILGCYCLEIFKPFCKNFLYFKDNKKIREIKEVIKETSNNSNKLIEIDDEDVTNNFTYYSDFFSYAWRFKKHWIVKASRNIFANPKFIRLLAKAGVKIIYLKEDWLNLDELIERRESLIKEKRKEVKSIQKEKILVGAKLSFILKEERLNFKEIFYILKKIDFDFLEIRFFLLENSQLFLIYPVYQPFLPDTSPIVLKREFYSLKNIIYRLSKRLHRVGFYNTLFYSLPLNLAYRQNLLEGFPFPP